MASPAIPKAVPIGTAFFLHPKDTYQHAKIIYLFIFLKKNIHFFHFFCLTRGPVLRRFHFRDGLSFNWQDGGFWLR